MVPVTATSLVNLQPSAIQGLPLETIVVPAHPSGDFSKGFSIYQVGDSTSISLFPGSAAHHHAYHTYDGSMTQMHGAAETQPKGEEGPHTRQGATCLAVAQ